MSELIRFGFEGQEVRTQQDEDGEIWFCVNDICAPLEHTNPRKAVSDLVDEGDVTRRDTLTSSGVQSMNYVNESGMYALVLGSRLESAKRFKRWVTHEVLPTLRKTGRYEMPSTAATKTRAEAMLLNAKVRLHAIALRTIDEIHVLTPLADDALSAVKAAITESTIGKPLPALKPKTSIEWFTPTQIAERLGVSANRVGLIISELGIRGNIDGICRAVLNKAAHSDKTVISYQYSEKAIEMIAGRLPAQIPDEAL